MSQENLNNQQGQTGAYQDPIASQDGKPAKKKTGGSTVIATVVSVIVVVLFGFIGGLICYAGYWAVLGIAKSKMPIAVRVILGIVVGFVFLILLIAFILFASVLRDSM